MYAQKGADYYARVPSSGYKPITKEEAAIVMLKNGYTRG